MDRQLRLRGCTRHFVRNLLADAVNRQGVPLPDDRTSRIVFTVSGPVRFRSLLAGLMVRDRGRQGNAIQVRSCCCRIRPILDGQIGNVGSIRGVPDGDHGHMVPRLRACVRVRLMRGFDGARASSPSTGDTSEFFCKCIPLLHALVSVGGISYIKSFHQFTRSITG